MRHRTRQILASLGVAAAVFGGAGVADVVASSSTAVAQAAAPGRLTIKHTGPAGSPCVNVQYISNATGQRYTDLICPGQTEGEGWPQNGNSEPEAFFIGAGWNASWRVNTGTIYPTGWGPIWTGVHPGNGYTGNWQTSVHPWNK
jgi:hypothetical protein